MADVVDYALVATLGAVVACGEIFTRYRDAPLRALASWSAGGYVAINIAAALAALALIRVFNVDFGLDAGDERRWTQVLVAGLGAMAFFRTSVFIAKVGDQDIGLGPSGVLQAMLAAAERGVDRRRAEARASAVQTAMANVSFERAQTALPTYCFALMQNVSQSEQAAVAEQIVAKLRSASMDDSTKALALGLALMNVVGEGVLLAAVRSLGDQIAPVPP